MSVRSKAFIWRGPKFLLLTLDNSFN